MRLRWDDLVVRELDGEVVMLSLSDATYFSANAAGALIVQRLSHGADRAALVDLLVEHYGIAPDSAGDDVDAFLTQLREHHLLVES